jgi:RimJ/RimL family protein N-acetyltransferase
MFTPIRTQRLLIRPFEPGDAAGLALRRNDPEVARYQNWTLPYASELAQKVVDELLAMDGPVNEDWWMAIVCDAETGTVYGDLALHLSWEGRTAEVGYTLAREHWGKGIATEALEALVAYLFEDLGVTRVFGMLHPDNIASAMVLERTGFQFEGHTKLSYWVGDDNSDDWIYGLVRSDWEEWRARPRGAPEEVRLVDLDPENQRTVAKLKTHKTQEAFVATVLTSYGDALFPEDSEGAPLVPWMRAIAADGTLAGFVMVAMPTPTNPEPFLWRLLIDRMHQRRGIGTKVLDLIAEECRVAGNTALMTSWHAERGGPAHFYLGNGFVTTGDVSEGEVEGRRTL